MRSRSSWLAPRIYGPGYGPAAPVLAVLGAAVACAMLAHLLGMECAQIAIPTRYDEEVSSLDPIPYGINVLKMMARHLRGDYKKLLSRNGQSVVASFGIASKKNV